MSVTINGTSGVTTPGITNSEGYTGDGLTIAAGAPAGAVTINSTYQTFSPNGSEAMRLDASGNLLVGTTPNSGDRISSYNPGGNAFVATVNASGAGMRITSQGLSNTMTAAYFLTNYGAVGSITCGSSTTYSTTSDYRLKENIAPMAGALDIVAKLKPCTYTWKFDGSVGQGFIAHELQAVVPDAVVGEKDAVNEDGSIKPQGIDTSFLVATLTSAIQEQQAMITELKARIEQLEAK